MGSMPTQEVEKEKGQLDKIQTEQNKPSPSPPRQFSAPVQVEPVSMAPPIMVPEIVHPVPQAQPVNAQSGTPVEPLRIKVTPMKEFPAQVDVIQNSLEEEHRRQ